jgi:hypothetical protein
VAADGERYDCDGVSPSDLLSEAGRDVIDLFKIDIEGGELPLFDGPCDEWLRRTRVILMEIHGHEADRVVRAALRRHRFESRRYREIHAFFNRDLS